MEKKWLSVLVTFMALAPLTARADGEKLPALELPPAATPVAEVAPLEVVKTHQLTYSEVSDEKFGFKNFRAKIKIDGSSRKAVVGGTIPSECVALFQFQWKTEKNMELFTVQDNGGGRFCIKEARKHGECGITNKCFRLGESELAESTLGDKSLKIAYGWEDPTADLEDAQKFQIFKSGDKDLEVLSKADRIAQENERRAQLRQDKHDFLLAQAKQCRADQDELKTAREALDKICGDSSDDANAKDCKLLSAGNR